MQNQAPWEKWIEENWYHDLKRFSVRIEDPINKEKLITLLRINQLLISDLGKARSGIESFSFNTLVDVQNSFAYFIRICLQLEDGNTVWIPPSILRSSPENLVNEAMGMLKKMQKLQSKFKNRVRKLQMPERQI